MKHESSISDIITWGWMHTLFKIFFTKKKGREKSICMKELTASGIKREIFFLQGYTRPTLLCARRAAWRFLTFILPKGQANRIAAGTCKAELNNKICRYEISSGAKSRSTKYFGIRKNIDVFFWNKHFSRIAFLIYLYLNQLAFKVQIDQELVKIQ